jgi:hypothetical protein
MFTEALSSNELFRHNIIQQIFHWQYLNVNNSELFYNVAIITGQLAIIQRSAANVKQVLLLLSF